jgi:hypothetical protein
MGKSKGRRRAFLALIAVVAVVALTPSGGAEAAAESPVGEMSLLTTTVQVDALRALPATGECLVRARLGLRSLDGGRTGSGNVCVTEREELPCGSECGLAREELDLELRLRGGTVRASLAGYVAAITDTATGTVSVEESFSGPVTGSTGTLAAPSGTVTWQGLLTVLADGSEAGTRLLTVALGP